MGVTETVSTPNSPSVGRVRRSLPEQGECDPRSPALSANARRSFRTSGRSSHSTSSEKSPFGTASARSSLRGSFNRGSPSPARKLTTPQGPNLATASRQRQCRCSETHHHGHHGHVTPVVPRVPLERERACRRSHGSNVVEDSSKTGLRRTSSRGSEARTSVCSRQSSMRDHSPSSADLHGRRDSSESRRDSMQSRKDSLQSRKDSLQSRKDSLLSRKDSAQEREDLSVRRGSDSPDTAASSADASSDEPTEIKGSVTTLVNWVPWLAEKRYYTTLKISTPQAPVMVTIPPHKKSSTETHHFKVIHTSSSAQPSFTTSIGAPPGAIVARLSMA